MVSGAGARDRVTEGRTSARLTGSTEPRTEAPPVSRRPATLTSTPAQSAPVVSSAAVKGIRCPVCRTILDRVFFTRVMTDHILRVRKCKRCRAYNRTCERIVSTARPDER